MARAVVISVMQEPSPDFIERTLLVALGGVLTWAVSRLQDARHIHATSRSVCGIAMPLLRSLKEGIGTLSMGSQNPRAVRFYFQRTEEIFKVDTVEKLAASVSALDRTHQGTLAVWLGLVEDLRAVATSHDRMRGLVVPLPQSEFSKKAMLHLKTLETAEASMKAGLKRLREHSAADTRDVIDGHLQEADHGAV